MKNPKPNNSLTDAAQDLFDALTMALEELKITLKEIGPCDHSVNICCCNLIRTIEKTEAALQKAKGG